MSNFLDILTALVRLQFIWLRRSDEKEKKVFVKRLYLVKWICDWIELATTGRVAEGDSFDGYLGSLWDSLGGDTVTLRRVCDEYKYCAELRAMLSIAQQLRYVPNEIPMYGKPPKSPKDVLKEQQSLLSTAFSDFGFEEPNENGVRDALNRYRMLSNDEIDEMVTTL